MMDEDLLKLIQEANILLAEMQRDWRGTPEYDKLDRIMDILNGDVVKALKTK